MAINTCHICINYYGVIIIRAIYYSISIDSRVVKVLHGECVQYLNVRSRSRCDATQYVTPPNTTIPAPILSLHSQEKATRKAKFVLLMKSCRKGMHLEEQRSGKPNKQNMCSNFLVCNFYVLLDSFLCFDPL